MTKKINIEPKLIEKKILRKMIAKSYKKKRFNQKILLDIKNFVIINWYYLLIVGLIIFILYLRWNDKKETFKDQEDQEDEEMNIKLYKKMHPSQSYVSDYYKEIPRTQPTLPPQYIPQQ